MRNDKVIRNEYPELAGLAFHPPVVRKIVRVRDYEYMCNFRFASQAAVDRLLPYARFFGEGE
jgi:hypothetical protein